MNDVTEGARVTKFDLSGFDATSQEKSDPAGGPGERQGSENNLFSIFPPGVQLGEAFSDVQAFLNHDGGWADSERGVAQAIEKARARGAKVIGGKQVEKLLKTAEGVTNGVRCSDEGVCEADLVLIATGSWTASSFPELRLGDKCRATG